jgi:sensor histidine kinase YesM
LRVSLYNVLLSGWLTVACLFLCGNVQPQKENNIPAINFPLPLEDFSLYDFAEVRFEYGKTETPPSDLIKKSFKPVKQIFQKDSLYFENSLQAAWFKFTIRNNDTLAASVALEFPQAVSKAVLYKVEGETLVPVGKTGFFIAVLARSISYHHARIDLALKARSQTVYFIQVILTDGVWMSKMPVLQSFPYAEMKAFNVERNVRRPGLMWSHFFTGVFFMFFVFGIIKYRTLGRDRAYLYYALFGLSNALLTIAQAEYPPLELPWFENIRGVELFNLVNGIAIFMQGLFILEILQLKIKYPRIALAAKGFLFAQLLSAVLMTAVWILNKRYIDIFVVIYPYHQFLFLLIMFAWVWYMATMREGFYRFIFFGALTIFIAFTFYFLVQFFNLYYLLPEWLGADKRGSVNHFMQLALLLDMCFYFTALAYRDQQVEKDKILFEEQLKQQQLESEKTKAELQQQKTELEMQSLRAQMNPHFIFNSLNAINLFILENNIKQASAYLSRFSRLVRLILQNSKLPLIPLESELEALELYLELEALRYDNHFDYTISVDDELDVFSLKVPPLIIQPYAENAIWHGLMHKPEKGHLAIALFEQDNRLFCKVTDDGVGRKKATEIRSKAAFTHKSMGMEITATRIAMLQQKEQLDSYITITDLILADGSAGGTEVTIKLPVHYDESNLDR